MNDLISVIVPIYNAELYLKICIDSIINQTYDKLEIILVDDGSNDHSSEICDNYALIEPRIHVIHQTNHGLVYSRKTGVRACHGSYILFVDADDWIEANMVSSLYALADTHDADVVISAANIYTGESSFQKSNDVPDGIYTDDKLEELKHTLFRTEDYFALPLLPYLWNKLWKTNMIYDYILSADENIKVGEDVAIGFPAILNCKTLLVTNIAYYYYRQNPQSMIREKRNEHAELLNSQRLYRYLNQQCQKLGYLTWLTRGIERYFINQLLTRSYSIVNTSMAPDGLFAFVETVTHPIILYGAGAFGCAVYDHARQIHLEVKAWIDGNAETLSKLDLPVVTLTDVSISKDDIIFIAVFKKSSAAHITNDLIQHGAAPENIFCFNITELEEKQLIESMQYIK